MSVPAVSQDEIMKALMREKALLQASTISAPPPITAEEIVADMQAQANPGQGSQKIAGNRDMGKPKATGSGIDHIDLESFFNVPGLKQMLKNDKR